MNRLVARLFGLVLAVIHILVFVALIAAILDVALGTDWLRSALPQLTAFVPQVTTGSPLERILTLVGTLVSYILVVGAFSTLVAINQHMAAMRRMSEEAKPPPSRSSSVRRRGDR